MNPGNDSQRTWEHTWPPGCPAWWAPDPLMAGGTARAAPTRRLGFDSKAVGPGRTWVLRHQRSTSEEKRQKRGDVELINYLQDAAGARNLVLDLSVTHARHSSSSQTRQNGLLTHPQVPDGPLHVAARKKISAYRSQYANNRLISFMPAITSTSCTASFCVSSFYRPTARPWRTSIMTFTGRFGR